MSIQNVRLEVMQFLEKKIDHFMEEFLIPVEKIWQPTDLLPDSSKENFLEEVKELREIAKDLPYDFWVVLVGDTITEEALPTYETWLMDVEGVSQKGEKGDKGETGGVIVPTFIVDKDGNLIMYYDNPTK